MAAGFSKTIITGRLGQEPEIKQIGENKVAELSVGVTRRFKQQGEEVTDWYRVSAWSHSANYAEQYLHKGDLVLIEGSMESRTVEKDGGKITYWNLRAENVQGLTFKPREEGAEAPPPPRAAPPRTAAPPTPPAPRKPAFQAPLPEDDDDDDDPFRSQ